MSWGPFYEFFLEKSLTMPKKTEREDPLGVFNIHFVAKHQKIEGGTLWEKFFSGKKVSQFRKKTERGDPSVSLGMVCYAGKQEKAFWFSSLGQMVQFGAIIFCRTILVSSGGLKKTLTKSHDYSRLFSKEKRRLKRKHYYSLY